MSKKNILIIFFILIIILIFPLIINGKEKNNMKNDNYNELTEEEKHVILNKGTEKPFTGKYNNFYEKGTYICKRCNTPLFNSENKFKSNCGWPSFDDEIKGAITKKVDRDGYRTEILCSNCGAHLGHVFKNEGFTQKNTRHCVNSISLKFIPENKNENLKKAYFAGGCFWGVEYHFEKVDGVKEAISGYMGGHKENPTYKEVCYKDTGHLEAVEVIYNPEKVNFEQLAKLFFEIHDPTQKNGQGPDIGSQYLSAIFYNSESEKLIAEKLINILKSKNYNIQTKLLPKKTFWKAEEYHQNYYSKHNKLPYCHSYKKKF